MNSRTGMKYNAFYFLIQKSVIMSVDLFFDRHIFCLLPELAGIIFLQKGADNLMIIHDRNVLRLIANEIKVNNREFNLRLPEITSYIVPQEYPDIFIKKIREFVVDINTSRLDDAELNHMINDLSIFLQEADRIDSFGLITSNDDSNKGNICMKLLRHLNTTVSNIYIRNVEINNTKGIFERFNELCSLSLINNNLNDVDFLNDIPKEVSINIYKNGHIYHTCNEKLTSYIIDTNHKIKSDILELNEIKGLAKGEKISLDIFAECYESIKNSNLEKIRVEVLDKPDEALLRRLSRISSDMALHKNIFIRGNYEDIKKLVNRCNITNNCYININKISDVSNMFLFTNKNIKGIYINNPSGGNSQKAMYRIGDFIRIKDKINEIKNDILPLFKSSLNEKEIFTRLYFKLAKEIEYDFDAVDLENNNDYTRSLISRNMIGGLFENKAVCAGYADILKNVCSELGIECHYVQGFKKDGIEGHSWNIVKLDNKYYNVDLTWDRNYIINNQRPKFFLKSDADFDHESYSEALTVTNICCEGSLDTKEQALLYDSLNLNMKQIFGRQINKIGAIVERYIAKNKDIVACSYDKQVIEHKQNSRYNNCKEFENNVDNSREGYFNDEKGHELDI